MIVRLLPACLLLCATASAALAQTYPSKSIRFIIPFPPGGPTDLMGRAAGDRLARAFNVQVIADNRAGAGGNIGAELCAKSPPDGYTICMMTVAQVISPSIYKKIAFDPMRDFSHITLMAMLPSMLTVHPALLAKTVNDIVKLAKTSPGQLTYASTGNGTGTHLAFADFIARTGVNMVHVPYKGGPEALAAVVKGDVCCIFNQVQSVLGQWKAGKVRLLGVTTKTRVSAVPDVPTVAEAGVPGYESYIWFGLHGPKGMDSQVLNALNAAVKKAVETPAVRQRLLELGNTPRYETPEQFRATVKADRAAWAAVVKQSGASVD